MSAELDALQMLPAQARSSVICSPTSMCDELHTCAQSCTITCTITG